MKLKSLDERFAICQLPADREIPAWVTKAASPELLATIKTAAELTVVCAEICVPPGIQANRGWFCFRIEQTLDFDVVGVIAKLSQRLANVQIPIFVVSTYNTDYVLIPGTQRHRQCLNWKKPDTSLCK